MKLRLRVHAIQRMFQRNIPLAAVQEALANGNVIEDYPNDLPYPSRLVLGFANNRPLHIVVADNAENSETIVITVYQPDLSRWLPGFRSRRKEPL